MFGSTLSSMVALATLLLAALVPSSTPQMANVSHVETVISYETPTDINGNKIVVSSQGGAEL